MKLMPFTLFFITLAAQAGDTSKQIADATQQSHNIESWWGKEIVQADVKIVFGGNAIVDGTFTFEAHGPRARYDLKDGTSIIFDGKTAWVTPATVDAPKGRFHVLTWPWFIMAPFKMQGDGIHLTQAGIRPMGGVPHQSVFQTFGSDMGDTPDDWYRFFINQQSGLIDGMSYIVTYGKDTETANKQPSIIKYFDYTDGDEPRIAQRYEFWYWNPETGETVGEDAKGTGMVSKIKYLNASGDYFSVPSDSRELKLPQTPIDYSGYESLLKKYVRPSGVDYTAWSKNSSDLAALDEVLADFAKIDLSKRSEAEQKAFYINLYNAGMLQAVFKNYPLESVKDIGLLPFSIFKKKFILQGESKLSLDDVEKEILLKDFFDPRIHFAVNCASESCPPLRAEAFTAKSLESQLDEQTRLFANSDRAARVNVASQTVAYSELFKWYAKDFGDQSPASYLNAYRDEALPLSYAVSWINYDWSLNATK